MTVNDDLNALPESPGLPEPHRNLAPAGAVTAVLAIPAMTAILPMYDWSLWTPSR
jgi:hypothetical protein